MAFITISIDCDVCMEEYREDLLLDARNNGHVKDVLNKAKEKGWHVGFRTLCPNCLKKQKLKCSTCKYRIEKSMCPPICELKSDYPQKEFIVANDDFCGDYKSMDSLNTTD